MKLRCLPLYLVLCLVAPWAIFLKAAQAQPLADGTAGTTVTCGGNTCTVTNGTAVGSNLFQSFLRFDVGSSEVVQFNGAPGVANILARVTGGFPSNIQGFVEVVGGANLFLMNPNGISFGPGATIRLNGSFVATTADAIELANGDRFSSNPLDPLPGQLLAVNPSAFLFRRPSIQPITSQASSFEAADGKSLLLVGGNVTLNSSQLRVFGGQIDLGGLASPGSIGLVTNGNQLSLRFSQGSDRADISLATGTRLDVTTQTSGGSINVYAHNFLMSGNSALNAGVRFGGASAPGNLAGDITLNATGWVQLTQESLIQNSLEPLAVGNAGNILIQANRLSITGASQITSLTSGFGSGGNVLVQVADALVLDGSVAPSKPSLIQSSTTSTAVGNSGSTTLTARTISLTNGAQIVASIGGQGTSGGITAQAQDWILLDGGGKNGPSGFFSTISGTGAGRSGDITLTAQSVTFSNGAQIASSTGGRGNAGNVTIRATGEVSLDGVGLDGASTSIFSGVNQQAIGQGGDILISAGKIALTNGGQLVSATFGQGTAGNTFLQATNAVILDGASQDGPSAIFAGVIGTGSGGSGTIQIQTPTLVLTNGGTLAAGTEGQGNAGNIQVVATNTTVAGSHPRYGYVSGFYTFTQAGGQGGTINLNTADLHLLDGAVFNATTSGAGNGGRINVTANVLQASGGGQFLTTTSGPGNAGSIQLTVAQSITLSGVGTGLFANTTAIASGNGGSIVIDPQQFILAGGASISVNSAGQGQAGNIFIAANRFTLDQGSITAATASGEGGNITLQVPELLLMRNGSLISATANGTGNGGNLSINAGFVVAVPAENSDIIANAFQGRGGNIQIATQGLFGITFQPQLTPRSDITASSEFGLSGMVNILKPEVDPSQGVTALPGEVVDAAGLVAQGCATSVGGSSSRFIVTGRGGLPSQPMAAFGNDAILEDVRLFHPSDQSAPNSSSLNGQQITSVPARGWLINQRGEVQLLAAALPMQCARWEYEN